MKGGPHTRGFLVVVACALLVPTTVSTSPVANTTGGQAYASTSWALGIVVPEGASLQGGGKVQWERASNVTAMLTLPNISTPDRITYAVLSVMTGDGAVLQTAVGISQNYSEWFVYSWFIPDVESVPLTYRWILNASGPGIAPCANITLVIFHTSGSWNLKVMDRDTGSSVDRPFPSASSDSFKVGDQEVFSFESYSRSGVTFRGMGNLTLSGLLVDGDKVVGGDYPYSGWDPNHSPLFVVGSSGTSPPSFVSVGQAKDGSFVWGYNVVWGNRGNSLMVAAEMLAALLLIILGTLGVVLLKTRKSAPPPPKTEKRLIRLNRYLRG